ncbi:uncharacterized protein H6S33_003483 [Morchella sextelata]|uniref:uncharacterized protein n=1 Tax=Morchella sextelata TaxID=1174677 RepID=UPI001D03C350|nr:uncharacterized protein H6S33_003483 [Morchella sextelata]KAH0606649.1 hypothetical protein H6S33_003483 [Morchella sextelata]
MVNVPTIKLQPSGDEMPQVGFGLWKVTNATCADQVYNAIKTGYRLFDGAFDYANEREAGEGVRRAIADGLVKREDLFIVSKLWNTFHDREHVIPITKQSLEWWGLEYFDLYYIHFPVALEYVDPAKSYPSGWHTLEKKIVQSRTPIQTTWEEMEKLVDQGLAKNIGVSNFQGALLMDLLRYARIRPSVLQIEHHPYLTQETLLSLAKEEGIAVTAYSSFGPQSFLELEMKRATDTPTLFENNIIKDIAKKVGKTPAQVLLRWSTQRGLAVIPKSNAQERLLQNLDVTGWDLEKADLEAISSLDKNLRFNNPTDYLGTLHIFG